jgi:hypothetical protein
MLHSRLCALVATIIALAVVILATPLAAQDPFPDFGKRFTQYSGNPLLKLESVNPWGLPKPEEPDTAIPGTIHPDVLYFPEGKDGYKFWMVFTPYEGWEPCPPPPAQCPPCGGFLECPPWPWTSVLQYWERITLLRSNDGIDWKKDGINNPVVSPEPFATGCNDKGEFHADPDLVFAENQGPNGADWFLYFVENCEQSVIRVAFFDEASQRWTIYPDPVIPWENGHVVPGIQVAGPTVVYDPQTSLFYGWYYYGPGPGAGEIGFATSTNGIAWSPARTEDCPTRQGCWENGVLKPQAVFCECTVSGEDCLGGLTHPDVIKKGNEFWIYYQVNPTAAYHDFMIRRATSTDGVNWTKDPSPVLSKYGSCPTSNEVPGQWIFWDREGPASAPSTVTMFYRPSVVVVDNAMYLYFGALNKPCPEGPLCYPSDRDIGLAFSTRFNDVPPIHWAYKPIEAVAEAEIGAGCGNNNFCPQDATKRQEAASFIAKAAGLVPQHPEPGYYFCDVGPDFAADINAVYEAGITAGCGDCTPDPRKQFCPTDPMNRLDLGLWFYVALGLSPSTGDHFRDVDPLYKPKIESLYDAEIVAGCGPNTYCPGDPAERAMLADMTVNGFLRLPNRASGASADTRSVESTRPTHQP